MGLSSFIFFLVSSLKRFFSSILRFGAVQGYPRYKIDFGAYRKRVCDFLLGRHSNFRPILHRFGDIARFLHPTPTPL